MKAAEEILKETMDGDDLYTAFSNWHPQYILKKSIEAIKIAQTEAIEKTVKACAEAAQKPYLTAGMTNLANRSRQSIFEVGEQLKSKLL